MVFFKRFALIFVCAWLAACGGRVELLSAVPEADANEVIAALINAGITAEKTAGKEGLVGVRVEQAKVAQAIDTLRIAGLPRESHAGMGQVFKKDGLISSPLEERARYLHALSQDLSATLSRIDGVLFARVHLVLPERGAANASDMPSSAAVFIKHTPDSDIEFMQPQVRRMVANSISGLATERVTVVFVPATASPKRELSEWVSFLGMRVEPAASQVLANVLLGAGLLLVLSLGGCAYLVWRYALPARRASAARRREAA